MEKRLNETFSQEVEKYRRILLSCAAKREWNSFKLNAGKLFDYVESIEMSVLQKKFFRISAVVICLLFLSLVLIIGMGFGGQEEITRLRKLMLVTVLSGSSFQLYFFVNYRNYIGLKTTYYRHRRERFIKDIEQDFRSP